MITVTTSSSVSPMLPPSMRTFSARPVGQQPAQRLALLLAVDDRLVQRCAAAAARRPRRCSRRVTARGRACSTVSATAAGVGVLRGGDRLDRPALGDLLQQLLLVGGQPADPGDRVHERLDDRGVEHRAAGRDLAHGPGELVALGDAVLEQVRVARGAVGEQRDRVLGIVVLREHDHAGARVALAQLLGGVDALRAGRPAACGCRSRAPAAPRPRPRRSARRSRRRSRRSRGRARWRAAPGRPRGRSRCRRRGRR